MFDKTASNGIGWTSIGIGLSELMAPQQLESMMGVGNGQTTGVLRALGVREVMHGIDILSHRDPAPGLWSRVAGDALDLALLGIASRKTRRPGGLATAFAMVLGITALDLLFAARTSGQKRYAYR